MGTSTTSLIRVRGPLTTKQSLAIECLIITGQITTDHLSTSSIRSRNSHSSGSQVNFYLNLLIFVRIADPENVIVVHCNSGKGRTGTAICAILLYMGYCDNIDDCLRFYGHQRFVCGKGVSQPCQLRYLYYFEGFYKKQVKSPSVKRLRAI